MSNAGTRPTILVVDDDPQIRDVLTQILQLEGYPLEVARNGQEAITLLENDPNKQRIMVLDLLMPIVDGWGVVRWLVVEHPEIKAKTKIVLISAHEHLKKASDLEHDAKIQKPFGPDTMLEVLQSLA